MTDGKNKGRKRHIVVDIFGNFLSVCVNAVNLHDTTQGGLVVKAAKREYPSLQAASGDAGYRGTTEKFVQETLKMALEISKKLKDAFAIPPKRWIVERTFAWMGHFRRLAKDFEILPQTAENRIRAAMIKIRTYLINTILSS